MAKARTGSFYLTETIAVPNGTPANSITQGSLDLGAYVNVPTGQAIAIESVDFIIQVGANYTKRIAGAVFADSAFNTQLSDLNPGGKLLRADNQSLVASGAINIDFTNNLTSEGTDFFPDNFGTAALSEAFMVVNDTLYLTFSNGDSALTDDVFVTARVRARVVKLAQEDWMAIAIQSTASDN